MRNTVLCLLLTLGITGCGDDTGSGGSGASAAGGDGQGAGSTGGGPVGGGGSGGGPIVGPGFSCDPATGSPPTVDITQVTSVPGTVVQIKSAPGAPDRLFIVSQDGQIYIFEDGALKETPFLDVSDIIRGGSGSEEGLLGLAFHPDYATNGRFFIHYSSNADSGASTIMEYAVSDDPLVASNQPVQLVLQHETDQLNHNGGAVEFGNDGLLYISMGDGGEQCDPGCDAMNPDRLLGKISRVDVDATPTDTGYPAASGNPNGAKWYHDGLRNPWRISFDACTGDLYIGDVGQDTYEEVDVATTAAGPLNFGWPIREGMHDQEPSSCAGYDGSCIDPPATFVDPIAEYSHAEGVSVTGGYVYRGSQIPDLRGWYFYGDYETGFVRILRAEGGALVEGPNDTDAVVDGLTSFGQNGNGEIFVGAEDGSVYQIIEAG